MMTFVCVTEAIPTILLILIYAFSLKTAEWSSEFSVVLSCLYIPCVRGKNSESFPAKPVMRHMTNEVALALIPLYGTILDPSFVAGCWILKCFYEVLIEIISK